MKNDERKLRLAVSDNGCGMDRSPPAGRGIGLNLIQYRANLMGGTLEIETKPGAGTRVICEVPATPPAGTTNDSH
jgi:signal transduction histidine kinase